MFCGTHALLRASFNQSGRWLVLSCPNKHTSTECMTLYSSLDANKHSYNYQALWKLKHSCCIGHIWHLLEVFNSYKVSWAKKDLWKEIYELRFHFHSSDFAPGESSEQSKLILCRVNLVNTVNHSLLSAAIKLSTGWLIFVKTLQTIISQGRQRAIVFATYDKVELCQIFGLNIIFCMSNLFLAAKTYFWQKN